MQVSKIHFVIMLKGLGVHILWQNIYALSQRNNLKLHAKGTVRSIIYSGVLLPHSVLFSTVPLQDLLKNVGISFTP